VNDRCIPVAVSIDFQTWGLYVLSRARGALNCSRTGSGSSSFFFDRSSSSPAIRDSNWGAGYAVACSNTINGGGHSGGSAGGQGEGGGGVDLIKVERCSSLIRLF